ncbi:hypothetical protein Bhyg_07131 [Pseudolycoriella hygida]|uniref:Uncharacterized protein n=1 Tax=Pseudolycoriella hygida TaxID=35572 RepID=A0A9Q0N223_9DIPT|nr:hypothetical protein Bhyg_07131 [Pseudolycoriella hygida]
MNAEPAKRDGKIKQQVEIEHEIRRRYQKKWGDIAKDPRINLYNSENLNKVLAEINGGVTNLYEYDNSGDSFFVSKDMYKALYQTCRCGRPKTDTHSLKCLQKVQNPYLKNDGVVRRNEFLPELPKTSLGVYGWPKNRFTDWELSTRYTSPKFDMPGGRIDGHPFSNVFIG